MSETLKGLSSFLSQHLCPFQVNPDMHPDIPAQVDNFTNLCPLEAVPGNLMQKSHTFGYVTSVYKVSYFFGLKSIITVNCVLLQ